MVLLFGILTAQCLLAEIVSGQTSDDATKYNIWFVGMDGAGDFTPIYNLLREAVHRGHTVTLFNELPARQRCHLQDGVSFVAYDAPWFEEYKFTMGERLSLATSEPEKLRMALEMVLPMYYNMTFPTLAQHFSNAHHENKLPDLVVTIPFLYSALDLCERYGVRAVNVNPNLIPPTFTGIFGPSTFCQPKRGWSFFDRWAFLRCVMSTLSLVVQPILELQSIRSEKAAEFNNSEEGVSSLLTTLELLHTRHPMLVTSVPGLSPPIAVSPLVHFVGPLIDERDLMKSTFAVTARTEEDIERVLHWRQKRKITQHASDMREFLRHPLSHSSVMGWLDHFPSVVVLAFGTTGMPSSSFICKLLQGLSSANDKRGERQSVMVASLALSAADLSDCLGVSDPPLGTSVHDSFYVDTHSDAAAWENARLDLQPGRLPGLNDVIVVSWMAQKAILAHANVKIFGSHCGFGSLSEAMYFGKPVLAYPFHWDQHGNALNAEMAGTAQRVSPYDSSLEDVEMAWKNILDSFELYEERAAKISRLMHLAGGVKVAMDVCEQEIELGSQHLVDSSASLMDVWITLLAVVIVVAMLLSSLLTCCCFWCRQRRLLQSFTLKRLKKKKQK